VDLGGTYALKSFESGTMGKEFHFVVDKSLRGNAERAGTTHTKTVEVGMQ
jgi:hypothetical protein